MKSVIRGLASRGLVIALLLCPMAAVASQGADNNSSGDLRDFWSINGGIAYAWSDHALRDFEFEDSATLLTGGWGWGPNAFPDWLGVEAELGFTPTDGRWQGDDWSLITGGAYFSSYVGSEQFYLKLRAGIAANQVDVEGFTNSDVGLAVGGGFGFQLLGQPLELQITSVDSNINTITLHWRF